MRKWGPNLIFLRTVTLKFHNDSILYKNSLKDSPPKNANSVIIYSPICHSKSVRLIFLLNIKDIRKNTLAYFFGPYNGHPVFGFQKFFKILYVPQKSVIQVWNGMNDDIIVISGSTTPLRWHLSISLNGSIYILGAKLKSPTLWIWHVQGP